MRSDNEKHTKRIAAEFVQRFLKGGGLVLLGGELGAGKTVFVKGMAEGLGIDPNEIVSPTFTLIHEHLSGIMPLFHMDLYRIDSWDEVQALGISEYLLPGSVTAIEWGNRFEDHFPSPFYRVEISWSGEKKRYVKIFITRNQNCQEEVKNDFGH